eukprot:6457821-Amphidinium_carterae.1
MQDEFDHGHCLPGRAFPHGRLALGRHSVMMVIVIAQAAKVLPFGQGFCVEHVMGRRRCSCRSQH